jgi:anti-sigma factor RsiW
MNDELAIKVQAFLDGELPEAEAREISALIAGDADVAALHKELKNTRAALAGFEKRITLPETREFYWSKIQQDIERAAAAQERPASEPVSLFRWLRRALIPLAGFAALALVLVFTLKPAPTPTPVSQAAQGMEVASDDSSAMTYRDYQTGTTLVWLSFPAENGLAGNEPAATLN